jgi:hypothetical protein
MPTPFKKPSVRQEFRFMTGKKNGELMEKDSADRMAILLVLGANGVLDKIATVRMNSLLNLLTPMKPKSFKHLSTNEVKPNATATLIWQTIFGQN